MPPKRTGENKMKILNLTEKKKGRGSEKLGGSERGNNLKPLQE